METKREFYVIGQNGWNDSEIDLFFEGNSVDSETTEEADHAIIHEAHFCKTEKEAIRKLLFLIADKESQIGRIAINVAKGIVSFDFDELETLVASNVSEVVFENRKYPEEPEHHARLHFLEVLIKELNKEKKSLTKSLKLK